MNRTKRSLQTNSLWTAISDKKNEPRSENERGFVLTWNSGIGDGSFFQKSDVTAAEIRKKNRTFFHQNHKPLAARTHKFVA